MTLSQLCRVRKRAKLYLLCGKRTGKREECGRYCQLDRIFKVRVGLSEKRAGNDIWHW